MALFGLWALYLDILRIVVMNSCALVVMYSSIVTTGRAMNTNLLTFHVDKMAISDISATLITDYPCIGIQGIR